MLQLRLALLIYFPRPPLHLLSNSQHSRLRTVLNSLKCVPTSARCILSAWLNQHKSFPWGAMALEGTWLEFLLGPRHRPRFLFPSGLQRKESHLLLYMRHAAACLFSLIMRNVRMAFKEGSANLCCSLLCCGDDKGSGVLSSAIHHLPRLAQSAAASSIESKQSKSGSVQTMVLFRNKNK